MKTFQQLNSKPQTIPTSVSWYLADLGEARGKQELFTKQAPQKLKVLREHALVESAISSNRIEGVTVDQRRVGTIIFGRSRLRDRSEEEIRCYRDALRVVHERGAKLQISESTILELHRLSRGEVWDAGRYKEREIDIIEKLPGGRERIRFKTVEASKTPAAMNMLIKEWNVCLRERTVPSLIALAAFNLDFLCIHPFRDGNGRVSRLLLLLQCYHLGYEVGRYISLERWVEQNKERYYETLEESSQGWHQGKHSPWPYVNFVLFILKSAYREFEDRVGKISSPKGSKTELVTEAIQRLKGSFRIGDLQKECPGVSIDLIRHILKRLRNAGKVRCLGRGQNAQWERTANARFNG